MGKKMMRGAGRVELVNRRRFLDVGQATTLATTNELSQCAQSVTAFGDDSRDSALSVQLAMHQASLNLCLAASALGTPWMILHNHD
jgi:hypothetical protein